MPLSLNKQQTTNNEQRTTRFESEQRTGAQHERAHALLLEVARLQHLRAREQHVQRVRTRREHLFRVDQRALQHRRALTCERCITGTNECDETSVEQRHTSLEQLKSQTFRAIGLRVELSTRMYRTNKLLEYNE